MNDLDDTIDSFETWLDRKARARASGRLSVDDALSAYCEAYGLDLSHEDALHALSSRFEAQICEHTGELLFYAVIYV